jgi:formylmethanofuran dehydrogenase subunit E
VNSKKSPWPSPDPGTEAAAFERNHKQPGFEKSGGKPMPCTLTQDQIDQTISFHGHWCPGLASGIRAAEWALTELCARSRDEELVAVVETDMCGVDAIQFLTGCTFGKGNLIHKDYGKNAFTFYRRSDGKAARLVARPALYGDTQQSLGKLHRKMQTHGLTDEEKAAWQQNREIITKRIMESGLGDLFEISKPDGPAPQKARILSNLICEKCGESVMESRTRRLQEQTLCIPCFENMEKRF